MKIKLLAIVIVTVSLTGVGAKATELPAYELMGLPIALHQLLGSRSR